MTMGHAEIIIITGGKDSGKTTMLRQLLKGRSAKGIVTEAVLDPHSGLKIGYQAVDAETKERRLLIYSGCRRSADDIAVGRFQLCVEVLRWAEERLLEGIDSGSLVLDELGPLELEKKGYYDVLKSILKHHHGELILVIRAGVLESMLELFGIEDCTILNTDTRKGSNYE